MSRADCEKEWKFGSAGVWNETTEICSCPPGFTGRDDWKEFPSCHVDQNLAEIMHITATASSVILVVLATYAFIKEALKWDFARVPTVNVSRRFSKALVRGEADNAASMVKETSLAFKSTNSKSPNTDRSSKTANVRISQNYTIPIKDEVENEESVDFWDLDAEVEEITPEPEKITRGESPALGFFKKPVRQSSMMTTAESRRFIREWRRKRSTLLVFLWFIGYGVLSLLYYVPFILPEPQFRGNFMQNIGLALAAAQVLAGYYALIVTWYDTLPSVRLYGNLLKMNPLFIRYPRLVYRAVTFICFVILFINLILIVVVPSLDESLTDICNDAFLISLVVSLFVFLLIASIVSYSVRKVFRQMIDAEKKRAEATPGDSEPIIENLDVFKMAINTAWALLVGAYIAWVIASGVISLAIYLRGRYIFLLFNILALLAAVACTVTVFMLLCRTEGGLAPGANRSSRRLSKTSTVGTAATKRKTLHRLSKKSLQPVSELSELNLLDPSAPTSQPTTLQKLAKKKLQPPNNEADDEAPEDAHSL